MATDLKKWAIVERQFIKDEIKWFSVGAVLKSPSGDDITSKKIEELKARLEHANIVIDGDAS